MWLSRWLLCFVCSLCEYWPIFKGPTVTGEFFLALLLSTITEDVLDFGELSWTERAHRVKNTKDGFYLNAKSS